jgi:hypothetical protein
MQRNGTYWKLDTAEVFSTAHQAYEAAFEDGEIYSLALAWELVGEREGRR